MLKWSKEVSFRLYENGKEFLRGEIEEKDLKDETEVCWW